MLSRILTKAIYDQKRSLVYWNLGTVLLVFLVMTMYPAVQEAAGAEHGQCRGDEGAPRDGADQAALVGGAGGGHAGAAQ